jgi:hypothetical protein
MDVALTNAWIYYQLANEDKTSKEGARADFFAALGKEMMRQDVDWEGKYKSSKKLPSKKKEMIMSMILRNQITASRSFLFHKRKQ